MSTSRRSTTGCTTCKIKRKKCDEAKPQCSRCVASRTQCLYEYVEDPENIHRIKRTKPAPRVVCTPKLALSSSSNLSIAGDLNVPTYSAPLESFSDDILHNSNYVMPLNVVDSLQYASTIPPQPRFDLSLTTSHASLDLVQLPVGVPQVHRMTYSACGLTAQASAGLDSEDEQEDDNDPEGVYNLLWITPTMDKNVIQNTLPFVLQCYARWAITSTFEPRRAAYIMRNHVIEWFSSGNSRTRTILIANVMNMYTRNLVIDGTGASILNQLVLDMQTNSSRFMDTPPSFVPALERKRAINTLDSMLEV
ncbi:unnamed protein product [Rhizoctonia solani]|uniref:Zn(2)-C6 fungal-type domain-containing protein n=1 Tax=Rhizoctonia solani TaxID=456999 RepID=A0A8H3C7E4_9AGAM|nr:unnamed protein product [Rhizoctonia solani]